MLLTSTMMSMNLFVSIARPVSFSKVKTIQHSIHKNLPRHLLLLHPTSFIRPVTLRLTKERTKLDSLGQRSQKFYTTQPTDSRGEHQVDSTGEKDLDVLLKLPVERFELLSRRYIEFKEAQADRRRKFKALDEVACLLEDIRSIATEGASHKVDAYSLESALSYLSEHCLELELEALIRMRENTLFSDMKKAFSDEDPVTTSTSSSPSSSSSSGGRNDDEPTKLQFWEEDLKEKESLSHFLKNRPSLPTSLEKKVNEEPIQQEKKGQKPLNESNLEKVDEEPIQQEKKGQKEYFDNLSKLLPTPLKKVPFYAEQFKLIATVLKLSNYNTTEACQNLKVTDRQLQKMMELLSKKGYHFPLPSSFILKEGILIGRSRVLEDVKREKRGVTDSRKFVKQYIQSFGE